MNVEVVMKMLLLLVLGVAAIDDLITRSIHLIYVAAFLAGALLLQVVSPQLEWRSMILGMLLGVAVYIFSYIGDGVIGSGDAYVLAMCGAYLGISSNVELLARSIMLAGVYGLIMIIKNFWWYGRGTSGERIPFVPFILTAYISMLWGKGF